MQRKRLTEATFVMIGGQWHVNVNRVSEKLEINYREAVRRLKAAGKQLRRIRANGLYTPFNPGADGVLTAESVGL